MLSRADSDVFYSGNTQSTFPEGSLGTWTRACADADVWGMLIGADGSTTTLYGDKRYAIGRDRDSDVLVDNKHVSGKHCLLYRVVEVDAPHPQLQGAGAGSGVGEDRRNRSGGGPLAHGKSGTDGNNSSSSKHGQESAAVSDNASISQQASQDLWQVAPATRTSSSHSPQSRTSAPHAFRVRYYVEDLSTNGTYVNNTKVGKGRRCEVFSGDDVAIVQQRRKRERVEDGSGSGVTVGKQNSLSSVGGSGGGSRDETRQAAIPVSKRILESHPEPPKYIATLYLHIFKVSTNDGGAAFDSIRSRSGGSFPSLTPPMPNPRTGVASRNTLGSMDGLTWISNAVVEIHKRQWQWGHLIGRGASSEVFAGIDMGTGKMIAVKVLLGTGKEGALKRLESQVSGASSERMDGNQENGTHSLNSSNVNFRGRTASRMASQRSSRATSSNNGSRCTPEGITDALAGGAKPCLPTGSSFVSQESAEAPPDPEQTLNPMESKALNSGEHSSSHQPAGEEFRRSDSTLNKEDVDGSQRNRACLSPDFNEASCDDSTRYVLVQGERWYGVTPEHLQELQLLRSLSHRRIVQCMGFQMEEEGLCILLEYIAGGTLHDLVSRFGRFVESVTRLYALQILQGLEYLHEREIVHGDLKTANILVSDRGYVKISDFGTSKVIRHRNHAHLGACDSAATCPLCAAQQQQLATATTDTSTYSSSSASTFPAQLEAGMLCGTPAYMSPDLVKSQISTYASDIWALGCIVLEMTTGSAPWSGEIPDDNKFAAVYFIGSRTSGPSLDALEGHCSKELIDFFRMAFMIEPAARPTASQLLKHPFITNFDIPTPNNLFPSTPPVGSLGASPLSVNGDVYPSLPPHARQPSPLLLADSGPSIEDHRLFLQNSFRHTLEAVAANTSESEQVARQALLRPVGLSSRDVSPVSKETNEATNSTAEKTNAKNRSRRRKRSRSRGSVSDGDEPRRSSRRNSKSRGPALQGEEAAARNALRKHSVTRDVQRAVQRSVQSYLQEDGMPQPGTAEHADPADTSASSGITVEFSKLSVSFNVKGK